MLRDNTTGRHSGPPRDSRPSKRVIPVLSGILVIALVAGTGFYLKKHFAASSAAPGAAASTGSATDAAGMTGPGDKPDPGDMVSASPGHAGPDDVPPAGWTLKFDPSLQGSKVDSQVWATCYPWATTGGCTNYGNFHDPEQEWYLPSQVRVSGGSLDLTAVREPTQGLSQAGQAKQYACRSGMVTTYPSLRFKYGYIQVTAKIPFGKGLWPALWLAAANQKWPPEIDILEHWASHPDGNVYLHPLTGARQGGTVTTPGLSAGWHTFGLYWTKTALTWYYDGTAVFATTTDVPQQDMYLIANLAVDDATAGGCSGSMLIKSVKVWQPPS